MAVRLHVQFDPQNAEHIHAIEEIARVPAGTHTAVQQYREEAKRLTFAAGDAGYEHWASVQDTPVGELDAFLTFGWGRLTPLGRQIADLTADDADGGSTTDPRFVAGLLWAQNAPVETRKLVLAHGLGVAWH